MHGNNNVWASEGFAELRRRAEEWLSGEDSPDMPFSREDASRLFHELQTYQIELELQNEDLRHAQRELTESRRRYMDLYDFAPVGYLTVNEQGMISEINLTACEMLGKERKRLLDLPLSRFVVKEDQDIYYTFRRQLQLSALQQSCELRLQTGEGRIFDVRLQGGIPENHDQGDGSVRLVMSDVSERLQLEKTIREGRQRLQMVIDTIPALISYVDNEERYVCCNREYEEWFGVSPKAIRGKSVREVVGERAYEQLSPHIRVALGGRRHEQEVHLHHRKLGERINFSRLVPHKDERGRVLGYIVLSTDITEEKRLQRQLAEQAGLLAALMDYVPEGIAIADAREGRIRMMSDYGKRMLDMEEADVDDGTDIEDRLQDWRLYLADGVTRVPVEEMPLRRAALAGAKLVNEEFFLGRPDGALIPILCNAGPIRDKTGKISGGIVAWRDISELKEKKDKLKRLQRVLEEMPDIISVADVHGRVMYFNRMARQVLRLDLDGDYTGQSIPINHPEWARQIITEEGLPAAIREGSWRGKTAVIGAEDGREIPTSQTLISHRDHAGRVAYFSTIIRDISDWVRHEEELQEVLDRLRDNNLELQQLAYIYSHDLTEPLRTIGGYLELFRMRYGDSLDDKAAQFINQAVNGVQRLERLIGDLLKYTRVDQGKGVLTKVDMNLIVDDVAEQLTNVVMRKKATIRRDDLPEVVANEAQMSLLIQNLVNNGLKFTSEEPPHVEVSAGRGEREWVFAVKDNGIGIDIRFKDRIFKVFQRLHRREEYPGTGIGLSICQKIVKKHGGRIWFESLPGRGSTFYFSLPDREMAAGGIVE